MDATRQSEVTDGRAAALVAAGVVGGWGALLGGIHYLGSSGAPGDEVASIAFGGAFVGAGLVAFVGILGRRPWFTASAGFALMPMALLTFNPIAFPVLPAAAVLLANGLAASRTWPRWASIPAGVVGVLLVLAVIALLFHDDPARWQRDDASHGSSDIITGTESAISVTLAGAAVAITLLGSFGGRRSGQIE